MRALGIWLLLLAVFASFGMPAAAQSAADMQKLQDYQKQIAPLTEKLQSEIAACGNDMACQMQAVFRLQSELADVSLPDVAAYPATECGLEGASFSDCRNVRLEIRYGFDQKSYEYDDDGPYLGSEGSLAFSYTVDGVLGFNDDFTKVHLFQRHPPLADEVTFQEGSYRAWRRWNGVPKADANVSLGNVNTAEPRNHVSFFDVESGAVPGKAELTFEPFRLLTGPEFEAPAIHGYRVPPDGDDAVTIDTDALRPLLEKGGTWSFARTFDRNYDDLGSAYHLSFSVKAVSEGGGDVPPPLATADPSPKKKRQAVLEVSPSGPFRAVRKGKPRTYQPRTKDYTLTNAGEVALSFTVTPDVPWVAPSTASGSLAPKQSQTVTLELNAKADALDPKKRHVGTVRFVNLTGGKGSTARQVTLSNKEKWRLSIFQRNDLFFGDSYLYGGVTARVRTDIDFEIEDGQYKSGSGKAMFASIKPISYPGGVFDCIVETYSMDKTAFKVSGKVVGQSVTLQVPANKYSVKYNCVTDTHELKDYYFKKLSAYYKLNTGKPLTAAQKAWRKRVVQMAESDASAVKKKDTQDFVKPMISGAINRALKDSYTPYGTKTSIDFEAIRVQRTD